MARTPCVATRPCDCVPSVKTIPSGSMTINITQCKTDKKENERSKRNVRAAPPSGQAIEFTIGNKPDCQGAHSWMDFAQVTININENCCVHAGSRLWHPKQEAFRQQPHAQSQMIGTDPPKVRKGRESEKGRLLAIVQSPFRKRLQTYVLVGLSWMPTELSVDPVDVATHGRNHQRRVRHVGCPRFYGEVQRRGPESCPVPRWKSALCEIKRG